MKGKNMSSFYTEDELQKIGFKSIGKNVLISKHASIYGSQNIVIGNNVRIDDFCILSGKIELGNNIHIAAGSFLFAGQAGIKMMDFSGLSSRCVIYAVSDDYSGLGMTMPVIPEHFRKVTEQSVILEKHALIGTGTTILPGANIAEGTAVGAMSLVTKPTQPWKIYFGVPAHPIKNRNKNILELEKQYLEECCN